MLFSAQNNFCIKITWPSCTWMYLYTFVQRFWYWIAGLQNLYACASNFQLMSQFKKYCDKLSLNCQTITFALPFSQACKMTALICNMWFYFPRRWFNVPEWMSVMKSMADTCFTWSHSTNVSNWDLQKKKRKKSLNLTLAQSLVLSHKTCLQGLHCKCFSLKVLLSF